MTEGMFITGTDTGVGKTTVACALLRRYASACAWAASTTRC
jgi:dethiobiotin synthetase